MSLSAAMLGSPPRMRGKARGVSLGAVERGITPAYAGKSVGRARCRAPWWDHPRVCGEKTSPKSKTVALLGSPPRMRGKGVFLATVRPVLGITPAYAGKRWAPARPARRRGDHPRVCGEKVHGQALRWGEAGSPPRMRGKESIKPGRTEQRRITPAYAGKSPLYHAKPLVAGDHPRVCGEKKLLRFILC